MAGETPQVMLRSATFDFSFNSKESSDVINVLNYRHFQRLGNSMLI